MTTHTDARQIDAFVDGELDLDSQLAMEERLRDDTSLRRQVDETRQLREAIQEGADYNAAPAALRVRIAAMQASQQGLAPAASPDRALPRADLLQRWFSWRPLAVGMGFAALLAMTVNLAWLQTSREQQLADDVLASHVRSTLGAHLVDVASSERHTVKPFLSLKLGFSPPVNELRIPGSTFLGGRVVYLDQRPVAALVYRQGEHIVNAFVWPSTGSDSAPRYSAERGYQTAHWIHGHMNHWVISDVNREEFQALVRALQAADAD